MDDAVASAVGRLVLTRFVEFCPIDLRFFRFLLVLCVESIKCSKPSLLSAAIVKTSPGEGTFGSGESSA